ncbi:ornithine cyclodeaminase family protein [Aestuariivirga sp.]|uniref:ornithine cyclodeaminase family protein n=1 Tax=Aestuariivirga sp. TaxID=2650926 RepID=UPI003BAA46F2
MSTPSLSFLYLNSRDVEASTPGFAAICDIVEDGLRAHGAGQVVLPPKGHIHLDKLYNGHFNILMGYVDPLETAGVKVIGDYVDNYKHDLPSEVALLTLYDPRTGVPLCLMDATNLTWLRTGAVSGLGAKHLARKSSRILAHIGARGTAFANIKAIAQYCPIEEVRINSLRAETREELARLVEAELGIKARAVEDAGEAVSGADIIVEATRLERPQSLITEAMLKPGALLITYGWISAIEDRVPEEADKFVVDDWRQCCEGGTFEPLIRSGRLTRDHLHAEIGEIAAGMRPGRQTEEERIVFWHRGFAISDIALGRAIYDNAKAAGRGSELWLR